MKKLPHILEAQPVIHGVLKVAFDDGYEGVVDLWPLHRQRGRSFPGLACRRISSPSESTSSGHSISWLDDEGYRIDLVPIRFGAMPSARRRFIG